MDPFPSNECETSSLSSLQKVGLVRVLLTRRQLPFRSASGVGSTSLPPALSRQKESMQDENDHSVTWLSTYLS